MHSPQGILEVMGSAQSSRNTRDTIISQHSTKIRIYIFKIVLYHYMIRLRNSFFLLGLDISVSLGHICLHLHFLYYMPSHAFAFSLRH